MAKLQSYTYQKGAVRLDFSFIEDEKLNQNKQDFLELLKEATEELKKELS